MGGSRIPTPPPRMHWWEECENDTQVACSQLPVGATPPHGGGSVPGLAMNSLRELARRVRTADVVDAMGRLHQHRSDLLDLVSPTPGRVLFGPAVTISYFPACRTARPPERYNFKRLFYEAIADGAEGSVLVLASNGYTDTSLGGGTKLSRVQNHRLAGILTDGRLRDFAELQQSDL